MEWSIDQRLYLLGAVIIPILIAAYRKRKQKPHATDNTITQFEARIKKLEDNVIKNHIEIDEARLEIAYIKGRLSND